MDDKLIENLQAERTVLLRRIEKINDLLSEYGVKLNDVGNRLGAANKSEQNKTANDLLEGVSLSALQDQVVPLKVLFALRNLGRGTAQEVADKLIELIPDYNPIRAFHDCRHWLSKYNVQGKINSIKLKNKNIYSWKP